jgi:hypothetical protein
MKIAEMRAKWLHLKRIAQVGLTQVIRQMARLCVSTHDQPNLSGDGGEWLDLMPFPAHLSARVASIGYDLNHEQMGAGKAR